MTEQFKAAILKLGQFSNDDIDLIFSKSEIQDLEKGDIILNKGEKCQTIYFVESGAFREFLLDEEGNEISKTLTLPGDWAINVKSFTGQKPSESTIHAYEQSQVVSLSMHKLHELIGLRPVYFQLGRILEVADLSIDTKLSPEEKYLHLLDHRPELLQAFPLNIIASYLRITPETLSRVRKKISR